MDNIEECLEEPPSEEPPGWRWQLRNKITEVPNGSEKAAKKFPVSITPYYYSLIEKFDFSDPIFCMVAPQSEELAEVMFTDPLDEDGMSPVPGLVHRYPDRALIISTTFCSVYCRYCTRKRTVGVNDHIISKRQLDGIVAYLKAYPQITDVIISGGDPLTFDTKKLEEILKAVREVESVQIIRIGTKVPVVLPQRIDKELTDMISKYHPVFINTHFNHPREITKESRKACEMLVNAGIPVGNQSVLLKGINDDKFVYEELCRKLIQMRVRPYYLFQCDLVNGVEHFRTRVARGIEIMEHLRGRLSGIAIPQYVIDAPGGKGKIPILPNYLISQTPEKVILRNYQGEIVEYPEPKDEILG